MQDNQNHQGKEENIDEHDSGFKAYLDEQYYELQKENTSGPEFNLADGVISHTFLGKFESVEAFKASLTEGNYGDGLFGLVGDKIVLVCEVHENNTNFIDTEMASYRNDKGGLISKEEYYHAAAHAELKRLEICQLQHNFRGEEQVEQAEQALDAAGLATAAAALAPGLGEGVVFTEASPFEEPPAEAAAEFLPLEFVIAALKSANVDHAFVAKVERDCHPDAGRVDVPEAQRIFLVNRALRLAISETDHEDTIQVRLLISDQISAENWRNIIAKGVIPAIKGNLPLRKAK